MSGSLDGELKSASDVPDISAEEMARRCDEVFANVSSFKSIQFDRKYNSFIRDMKDAIDDSSSMPTRLGELMSIHEFALQRREAGMAEEEARGTETEAPKPAPVVEEDTKSRLERRFKVVRHLKEDGGMAEVYLAQDNETGDRVIWKQAAPDRKTTLSTVNLAVRRDRDAAINRSPEDSRFHRLGEDNQQPRRAGQRTSYAIHRG